VACRAHVARLLMHALHLRRYRQSELQHARWAMLGVAGILGQEILNPGQFWCVNLILTLAVTPS